MTDKKETNLTIEQRLSLLQKKLKAPKEKNDKVAYKSRSAEQILEAAKECLSEGEFIICEDDIVHIGDRYYVKSISKFCFGEKFISTTAFAREQEEILNSYNKPMMQQPQVTGASSSYARKYSLQGLFALDDSRDDPDKHPEHVEKPVEKQPVKLTEDALLIAEAMNSATSEKMLTQIGTVRKPDIEKMPEDVRRELKVIYSRKLADLKNIIMAG